MALSVLVGDRSGPFRGGVRTNHSVARGSPLFWWCLFHGTERNGTNLNAGLFHGTDKVITERFVLRSST